MDARSCERPIYKWSAFVLPRSNIFQHALSIPPEPYQVGINITTEYDFMQGKCDEAGRFWVGMKSGTSCTLTSPDAKSSEICIERTLPRLPLANGDAALRARASNAEGGGNRR